MESLSLLSQKQFNLYMSKETAYRRNAVRAALVSSFKAIHSSSTCSGKSHLLTFLGKTRTAATALHQRPYCSITQRGGYRGMRQPGYEPSSPASAASARFPPPFEAAAGTPEQRRGPGRRPAALPARRPCLCGGARDRRLTLPPQHRAERDR